MRHQTSNLIDNAIKYGGTQIVITAIQSDKVVISVGDNGDGIPKEQ